MAGKYWCFHCGAEADSPAEIVHADDCRRQVTIFRGVEKRECKWCDGCGCRWSVDKESCPWCNRELKTIYC